MSQIFDDQINLSLILELKKEISTLIENDLFILHETINPKKDLFIFQFFLEYGSKIDIYLKNGDENMISHLLCSSSKIYSQSLHFLLTYRKNIDINIYRNTALHYLCNNYKINEKCLQIIYDLQKLI